MDAASRVVLYFDQPEDALRFTLAASEVMSENGTPTSQETLAKIALEISRAIRITTECDLGPPERALEQLQEQCA